MTNLSYCPKCGLVTYCEGGLQRKVCPCEVELKKMDPPPAADASLAERWRFAYGLLVEQTKNAVAKERQEIMQIIAEMADSDDTYAFVLSAIERIGLRK